MNYLKEATLKIKDKIIGSPIERSLEEATSITDENLNVPTRVLQEIGDRSNNPDDFEIIMKFLWMQLLNTPDKWRKILKTLNLIHYLLKNGNVKIVGEVRDEIYQFRMLKNFSYKEGNEERGLQIQNVSFQIEQLLSDQQLLEQERKKAEVVRERLKGLKAYGSNADGSKDTVNRYEGFSSKDVDKIMKKKAEDSPTDKKDSLPSPANKENKSVDDNEFVIRQNTKYCLDLTKDEKAKKEQKTQQQSVNLIDMDIVPTASQKPEKNTQPVPKEATNNKPEANKKDQAIWAWDQPTYQKTASSQNNLDFDWDQAPASKTQNDNVLGNVYHRAQTAPIVDDKANAFEWDDVMTAPVNQATPTVDEFDTFQTANTNNTDGKQKLNSVEKAMTDLSQMGLETKISKISQKEGFIYSTPQALDDLFSSLTVANTMVSPIDPPMTNITPNMFPNGQTAGNMGYYMPNMQGMYSYNNQATMNHPQGPFGGSRV